MGYAKEKRERKIKEAMDTAASLIEEAGIVTYSEFVKFWYGNDLGKKYNSCVYSAARRILKK